MEVSSLSRAPWRQSSYSGTKGNCVEVAADPGVRILLRGTRDREGPVLAFRPDVWRRFAGQLKVTPVREASYVPVAPA